MGVEDDGTPYCGRHSKFHRPGLGCPDCATEGGAGRAIIVERSKIRGAFTEQARVSQNLKHSMRDADGWGRLLPAQKEALDNMANKMARILTGDPHEYDSWADISGYAELIIKNGNYTERNK